MTTPEAIRILTERRDAARAQVKGWHELEAHDVAKTPQAWADALDLAINALKTQTETA